MAICKQFTEVWKSAKFSDLSNIYNDLPLDDGVGFYFKIGGKSRKKYPKQDLKFFMFRGIENTSSYKKTRYTRMNSF